VLCRSWPPPVTCFCDHHQWCVLKHKHTLDIFPTFVLMASRPQRFTATVSGNVPARINRVNIFLSSGFTLGKKHTQSAIIPQAWIQVTYPCEAWATYYLFIYLFIYSSSTIYLFESICSSSTIYLFEFSFGPLVCFGEAAIWYL
jgi:hypothetical protein